MHQQLLNTSIMTFTYDSRMIRRLFLDKKQLAAILTTTLINGLDNEIQNSYIPLKRTYNLHNTNLETFNVRLK